MFRTTRQDWDTTGTRWMQWDQALERSLSWKELWETDQDKLTFLLRGVADLLPTPNNLKIWGKEEYPSCKHCGAVPQLEPLCRQRLNALCCPTQVKRTGKTKCKKQQQQREAPGNTQRVISEYITVACQSEEDRSQEAHHSAPDLSAQPAQSTRRGGESEMLEDFERKLRLNLPSATDRRWAQLDRDLDITLDNTLKGDVTKKIKTMPTSWSKQEAAPDQRITGATENTQEKMAEGE
ncbi:unnamed protein product [Leuciscus chuanchicus]